MDRQNNNAAYCEALASQRGVNCTSPRAVGEFKGYIDGEPAVRWFDRKNMPQAGDKLFLDPARAAIAEPRTWSILLTSANHGTVGPAGSTFPHAGEQHERVQVMEIVEAGAEPAPGTDLGGLVRIAIDGTIIPLAAPSAPIGASVGTPVAQVKVGDVPRINITLRQAEELVECFGGHDAEVSVIERPAAWADMPDGLYAYFSEYPCEGSMYLGPTEVDDDLAMHGEPAPAPKEAGPAIPAGWRLAPESATPEMKAAGGHSNSEWLNDNAPIGEARYAMPMESVWAAMLAAAPAPSISHSGEGVASVAQSWQAIGPLPVERDENGWWSHPAIPKFDEDFKAYHGWLKAVGLEIKFISLESYPEHPLYDAWFERGECDASTWEPEEPAGAGWFTFSIHDSEDGPVWVWARRSPQEAAGTEKGAAS